MLASELYALSQQSRCEGELECHWCSSPCRRVLLHDEPPRLIGVRSTVIAKRPNSPYICIGCWLFRRKNVTMNWLSGGLQDRQKPCDHSLLIVEGEYWGIRKEDYYSLYEKLLQPPLRFCLALLDGKERINHIQLSVTNDLREIRADTPLEFTINSIPHVYTIYELKIALKNNNRSGEVSGVDPGTAALVKLLGSYPMPEKERKRGRPSLADSEEREVGKVIVRRAD